MLSFTPLSGAAKSSRTSPLAYLLQVDDINILLDCGSPDWCPESHPSTTTEGDDVTEKNKFPWEQYCDKLRECVSTVRSQVRTAVLTWLGVGSRPPSTSFYFPMEISHIPGCILMRTQGGVSKLRRTLLFPCKPWPA